MTLYKEGEGHFSIISNDKQFTMAFAYNNTYGFNSIGVWDELSKKILVFNFSEEGELRSYKYEDGKYFVTTNVLFVPLDNKFITRAEFINDYETIYELFEDGTVKITFRDIETGVWE
jgi:hypothetical protein